MQFLMNLVVLVQLASAVLIIGLVLIQHGKGADMGASFGSGASGTLFGATGSANALSRATAVLATIFFVSTLALAHFGTVRQGGGDEAGEGLLQGSATAASMPSSGAVSGAAAIPGGVAIQPASGPASQP